MQAQFKKVVLASAVAAGLAGVSQPSQALVEAIGEAQLVPLVVWADANGAGSGATVGDVNTVIDITVPNVIGWEDVANTFLAPHTSPTNPVIGPGALLFPDNQALVPGNFVHWYWFDQNSVHRLNRREPVTPDDIVQINWKDATGSANAFNGVPGYMVIGTEIARTGQPADFAFYTDAHLLIASQTTTGAFPGGADTVGLFHDITITADIPVMALTDGADGAFDSIPTNDDNVKYNATGIPRAVSPLISGTRTSLNDDVIDDTVVFDLTLSHRFLPTLLVTWLDVNLGGAGNGIGVDVFDTDEVSCSWFIDMPRELNLTYVIGTAPTPVASDHFFDPLEWATELVRWPGPYTPGARGNAADINTLCIPRNAAGAFQGAEAGMVKVNLPEYQDIIGNIGTGPETAMGSFSLTLDYVPAPTLVPLFPDVVRTPLQPSYVNVGTSLGHDRGMFTQ